MSQGESLSGRYGHATDLSLSLCRCVPAISGVWFTAASLLTVHKDVELYGSLKEVLTVLGKRTLNEPDDDPGGRDGLCWLTGQVWACLWPSLSSLRRDGDSLTDQRHQGLRKE